MNKGVTILLRAAPSIFWCATLLSFASYNAFMRWRGLHRAPCNPTQAELVFRSTTFCGSWQDARLWQLNSIALYGSLIAAMCFTAINYNLTKNEKPDL